MSKKLCLKRFLQGAGVGFFILAFWVAATKTPLNLQAGTINPGDDGPGGCCDPANPYDPVGGCRQWEECRIDNGVCSTNKSCCAKNSHGCSRDSDCCSGHCCSGTCQEICGVGPQLTCGANANGVWIENTGNQPMNGVSFSWFASFCSGTSCVCSGSPRQETVNLAPGQKITRGFTNSHPPCQWSWQTDVTASWQNQTCHRSANGCGSEPCITPSPTPTPTPTQRPTSTPTPTPTRRPTTTPTPTLTPSPTPTITLTPTLTFTPTPTPTTTPQPTSTPTPTPEPTSTPTPTSTSTPTSQPTSTPTPTPPQVLGAQAPTVLPKAGFSSGFFFFLAFVGTTLHLLAFLL